MYFQKLLIKNNLNIEFADFFVSSFSNNPLSEKGPINKSLKKYHIFHILEKLPKLTSFKRPFQSAKVIIVVMFVVKV
jgi:hypothetical protein